jgi:hypothetical protein
MCGEKLNIGNSFYKLSKNGSFLDFGKMLTAMVFSETTFQPPQAKTVRKAQHRQHRRLVLSALGALLSENLKNTVSLETVSTVISTSNQSLLLEKLPSSNVDVVSNFSLQETSELISTENASYIGCYNAIINSFGSLFQSQPVK